MVLALLSGERRQSYEQLTERVERAAQGLHSLGVGEGDAVALLLRNDTVFFEGTLAAQRLGALAVPINWHNTPEEVGYVLGDCGAKALLAHADLLPRLPPGVLEPARVLVAPTPPEVQRAYGLPPQACAVPAGAVAWPRWLEGFAPIQSPAPQVRASMIYTSGTTGKPKGVRRQPSTPESLARGDQSVREIWGLGPGVHAALTGPIYHSAPNAYALSVLRQQGQLVLQPRFEAEPLLALIQEHRISHMHMVPTMFVRLLRLPESVRARYDLSSLRLVIHGAAPCPVEVKRAMIEWWGPVIHEYYGSTELGMITTSSSRDWLERPGTVGRPTRYAQVRVLDEQGQPVAPGVAGLIYARNEGLTDFTYHGAPAKRREMERDGFMTNGDIGTLDQDGYLYLRDRKIDMVISGGVNIYPAEIESVLVQMPGVQDCAVFGIPDEEFGEALLAVVQPAPQARLDLASVQEFLRPHLADYKIPRRVHFAQDLPREDSGKIFKRKLREPYWAGQTRRI